MTDADIPRCGDHVEHIPSGEFWVVAYADDFLLAPAGWPDSRAQTASCRIVKRCTDEEHLTAVREWIGVENDSRRRRVIEMYGAAAALPVKVGP